MGKLQAKDLRIGNLAKRNGIVVTLDARSIFDIWNDEGVEKLGYEPLLLTEKWLLEFGFNKDYKKGYIGKDFSNQDFVLTEPFVMGEWQKGYAFQFSAGGWSKYKEFNYVHELQNFYQCLVGEQLLRMN